MASKLPLSVFIIAKNEADRIADPIRSVVDWADEVIVIDSGSTDETVALSEQLGARAIFNEWPGYGPQKRFGEQQCRNDWLLNLDADEAVSEALKRSIEQAFADGPPDCAAFKLYWRMVHYADAAPRPLAQRKSFIRLYDRRQANFRDSIVHDSVVVREGEIRELKQGDVLHKSFRSLAHFRDKLMEYADWQARDMFERGRKPAAWRAAVEPVASFIKLYLFRRYFIYGADGLAMSAAYAEIRKARLTKARARFQEAERAGGPAAPAA